MKFVAFHHNGQPGVGLLSNDAAMVEPFDIPVHQRAFGALPIIEMLAEGVWADGIYHAYNTFITGAKALLIGEGISTSSQHSMVKEFEENFGKTFFPEADDDSKPFSQLVFSINKNEPTEAFARGFVGEAEDFLHKVKAFRAKQLLENSEPALQELVFGQDS